MNEIEQIINLYNNCKNLNSFFSILNKRSNANLKNKFNEVKLKTCYFHNVNDANSCSQALYNILHNISEISLYKDGGIKIFKNINEGYYTEDEYNNDIPTTFINFIKDEKYIYPALKHLRLWTFKIF